MADNKVLGEKIMEIVEKFEVPKEYHDALWEAYEAGSEYGFFKALDIDFSPTKKYLTQPLLDSKERDE